MTATVLVVDDIPKNIKLLEDKLLAEYYTVLSANSGKEAIDILTNNEVDIILLDVMMPDIDGYETCKMIKSNPDTTYIPVVMVTANTDKDSRIKGLEAGADEFISKPIDDTALFARVKSLSRVKNVIDELRLRNKITTSLGGSGVELADNFENSHIILLNDDVIQIKNMKELISQLTKNIYSTSTMEGMEEYKNIDCIIISCQLDDIDPLRIVASLRSNNLYKDSIIMLLAEEEYMSTVAKGLDIGVNDYCVDPFDKNELLARVKTQLKRKQYQDQLRSGLEKSVDLSVKDGLTDLYNRRYFDIHIKEMVDQLKEEKRKICLLMLDVDHFKNVNDTYGHQVGDAILKKIAAILKTSFRVTDLIARYGGEEFIVALKNISLEDSKKIAEKLRKKVEDTEFDIEDLKEPIKKTVSMGLSEYKNGEPIDDLISRADKALYEAKETGRNKIITG